MPVAGMLTMCPAHRQDDHSAEETHLDAIPTCDELCMPVADYVDTVPCRQMRKANWLKRHTLMLSPLQCHRCRGAMHACDGH